MFTVVMGGAVTWMAVHYRRGSLPVNHEEKAEAIAAARGAAIPAAPATAPAQVTTTCTDNRQAHYHDHRQLTVHVHQAPTAAS